jgi:hypothetical protein
VNRGIYISAALMRCVLSVLGACLLLVDQASPFRAALARRIKDVIHQLERRRDQANGRYE